MLPVNFNQLYYFWVIAREGRISSAGERLFLTQSTLSVQIQKLERSLGKTLFTRDRHGVALTDDGRLAFDFCEMVFAQAGDFVRRMEESRPLPMPALKLGVAPAISNGVVLRITEFVRACGLDNRIQILSGGWSDLKDRLTRRKVDIVVADADPSNELGPDYRGRLVARLPLWFVGAPRWRASLKRFPGGLADFPAVLRNAENPVRKQVDHFLYKHRLSPPIASEVEDADLIRVLVLNGDGVAALDLLSVAGDLRERRLFKLHRNPLPIHQDVWFLFRRHHREEPGLQKSIDIIMDAFTLDGRDP
jgi:LysR family transcriptional regulator, transcriptional activator of nhaA